MSSTLKVVTLDKPSAEQLDRVAVLMSDTMKDDSIMRASTGDDSAKMIEFSRACAAGAAVSKGLELLVVQDSTNGNYVGAAIMVGPGKELMGDEEQAAQGFSAFLSKMDPETLGWMTGTFLPEYSKLTDDILGPGVKKQGWSIVGFGVAESARGKGVARLIEDACYELAKRDKVDIVVECQRKEVTKMYEKLGYEHVGSRELQLGGLIASVQLDVLRKRFQAD